jgi:hypothetical protein
MVLLIARVLASGRISPSLFNQEGLYLVAVGRFDRKWRPDSSGEDDKQISTSMKDLRFATFGASSKNMYIFCFYFNWDHCPCVVTGT